MKKVIIFGTGKTAEHVVKMIKQDSVQIVAFADNQKDKVEYAGKRVIFPKDIDKENYNYILIASVYGKEIERQLCSLGVNQDKIIKMVPDKKGGEATLTEYHYLIHNPFHERLEKFLGECKENEILVTGISYHNDGIDSTMFSRPAFNFAIRGQDIFYDYTVIKYLFQNYFNRISKVKYVIIGLSYYSFDYDFSKSSSAVEALRYYPQIQEAHNFIDNECIPVITDRMKRNLNKYKDVYALFEFKDVYELSDTEGEKAAIADSGKDFPYTAIENMYFLKQYIDFLKKREITPIVLIMPVTKYYEKYYKEESVKKFYQYLEKVIGEYRQPVQVLDYFNKIDIPDKYWYHINHLNQNGAAYFTKQLDQDIVW